MTRPTTCTFSSENLLHNLATIRATAPRAKIMAMVKANAYGHGIVEVGHRLDGLVDALGVASVDEALILRSAGVRAPITLIEGIFTPDEFRIASEQKFCVAFHHAGQIQALKDNPPRHLLHAWLKIDTGMGRLGFLPEDVPDALKALSNSPSLRQPVGILSHFACADEPEHPQNQKQITAFQKFTATYKGPKSFCNSAAIFSIPSQHYDWVRPGLSLYGASPLAGRTAESLGLKPVMTLRSRLISIKTVQQGETIGYGSRFQCPETMPVGIIAIGYGDGYPRSAQNGTPVLVNQTRCPVIGRVSMDMTAIDLRPCPTAAVGAEVTLWGDGLPIEEVAETTSNINYDLLTGVRERARMGWV